MTYQRYYHYTRDYIDLGRSAERLLGEMGYPEDAPENADDYTRAVKVMGAAADGDIKQLCELSALSMAAFAAKYGIPYRTLQDWCSGKRTPPEYLPMLLGYVIVTELWK